MQVRPECELLLREPGALPFLRDHPAHNGFDAQTRLHAERGVESGPSEPMVTEPIGLVSLWTYVGSFAWPALPTFGFGVFSMRFIIGLGSLLLLSAGSLRAQDYSRRYGDFTYEWTIDEMTDQRKGQRIWTETREARLGIECLDRETMWIYVRTQSAGDSVGVQVRFDNNTPSQPASWSALHRPYVQWDWIQLPMDRYPWFLSEARRAGRVAVRIDDGSPFGPHTFAFSLRGFTAAVANLPCRLPANLRFEPE